MDNEEEDIIPPSPKREQLSKITNLKNNIGHVTSAHNHDKSLTSTSFTLTPVQPAFQPPALLQAFTAVECHTSSHFDANHGKSATHQSNRQLHSLELQTPESEKEPEPVISIQLHVDTKDEMNILNRENVILQKLRDQSWEVENCFNEFTVKICGRHCNDPSFPPNLPPLSMKREVIYSALLSK